MAATEILPGIIAETNAEAKDIPVPFQAKTELDENCVTQHNRRKKAATLPYASASPNLPSRIQINMKPRATEILPPSKASDAWNTTQPVIHESSKDLDILYDDTSPVTKHDRPKNAFRGEMLVPPSREELPHQPNNVIVNPKMNGYQPSHPNVKLRRRPPTIYAAKCMPNTDSSIGPTFEESVLYSQLYMQHIVDAHGGQVTQEDDQEHTSFSADNSKASNTFSTGEECTMNTNQDEESESEKITLREVWAKMFGPGSYSSLPKIMGRNRKSESSAQELSQLYAGAQSSHSCDELSQHEYPRNKSSPSDGWTGYGKVHSDNRETMGHNIASKDHLKMSPMPQSESIPFHSNSVSGKTHSIQESGSSVPLAEYQNGNLNSQNWRKPKNGNNLDNKINTGQMNKLDMDVKYSVLAPLETNNLTSPPTIMSTQQPIRHESGVSSVIQSSGNPNTDIHTAPISKPETRAEIFYMAPTPDILLHNSLISNSSVSSTTPSLKSVSSPNTPQTPIVENPMGENNARLKGCDVEMSQNDTSICVSTDDTLECDRSSYSIDSSSSPTRKLKTRQVSSEAVEGHQSSQVSEQYHANKEMGVRVVERNHDAEMGFLNPQARVGSFKQKRNSHKYTDTSDSISVTSSIVGLKRERLSSRGRNGSFAATKYDKMKSPSSQSFAGFPQHTRQYSSTSDDQSFTTNTYSGAKSFATNHPSHGSHATDESRCRRYKLGYAKAKALKQRSAVRSHNDHEHVEHKDLDDSQDTSEQDMSLLKDKVHSLETNLAHMETMLKATNVSRKHLNGSLSSSDSGGKIHVGTKKYRKTNNHHKEIEHVKRRFQRLESHVVTLARSLAQLSSEMKSHHASLEELESVTHELQTVQEEQTQDTQVMEKQWMTALRSNTGSLNKLRRFFGEEPPMLQCFLKNLGYENYMHLFEDECISVIELPYINERRLENIGIPLGPRLRMIQEARLIFC